MSFEIDLKNLKLNGYHLDETVSVSNGEVFYVSDTSENDGVMIIPDWDNKFRSKEKLYTILYLKDYQIRKSEIFGSKIEDPEDALNNMSNWINASL